MRFIPRRVPTFSAAVLLAMGFSLALAGCGKAPSDVTSVTGVVTLDGEALPGAAVEFQPESGRPSFGTTDDAGRYTLQYTPQQRGAEIGSHTVRIKTGTQSADPETGELTPQTEKVPAKYNENTELTREVEAGSNKIDFELTTP